MFVGLADRASQSSPDRVLVITTDEHRVAAVEQMVRFGEILGLNVEVAISPEDLARTVASAGSPSGAWTTAADPR